MLSELPIVNVRVEDLDNLVRDPSKTSPRNNRDVCSDQRVLLFLDTDLKKLYLVHALAGDYLARKDGKKYDRADYYANPDAYESKFAEKV